MRECLSCNSTASTASPTSSFSLPTALSSPADYVVWTSTRNSKRFSPIANEMNMNKQTIITILLALVAVAGQAQTPKEFAKDSPPKE